MLYSPLSISARRITVRQASAGMVSQGRVGIPALRKWNCTAVVKLFALSKLQNSPREGIRCTGARGREDGIARVCFRLERALARENRS